MNDDYKIGLKLRELSISIKRDLERTRGAHCNPGESNDKNRHMTDKSHGQHDNNELMNGKHDRHHSRDRHSEHGIHHSHGRHHDMEHPTHMHMMIMRFLMKNKDKNVYQKDLEKKFSMRRPTATNMLKRMEAQGFIVREPVPGDARLKKIVLTPKALNFSKSMDEQMDEFEKRLIKGLTKEEINNFLSVIEKMKNNLEE